ncbi:hypothetical protein GCK72_006061 [Caenorhabditis remanei]|uniref:Uncharacterized protein n=1 Tax=Caenorhabditis remanei TaxID=31234 RepID=A0A6A5HFB6_CAERE|nr:hypothetical protein GCK72_006061 [Caenorhabditis remanei]KAF1766105.1 hypothetical protein GCK72_006061 [Caenorhabditis remanei]
MVKKQTEEIQKTVSDPSFPEKIDDFTNENAGQHIESGSKRSQKRTLTDVRTVHLHKRRRVEVSEQLIDASQRESSHERTSTPHGQRFHQYAPTLSQVSNAMVLDPTTATSTSDLSKPIQSAPALLKSSKQLAASASSQRNDVFPQLLVSPLPHPDCFRNIIHNSPISVRSCRLKWAYHTLENNCVDGTIRVLLKQNHINKLQQSNGLQLASKAFILNHLLDSAFSIVNRRVAPTITLEDNRDFFRKHALFDVDLMINNEDYRVHHLKYLNCCRFSLQMNEDMERIMGWFTKFVSLATSTRKYLIGVLGRHVTQKEHPNVHHLLTTTKSVRNH